MFCDCWLLIYRLGACVKCVMYLVNVVVYSGRDELCRGSWIIQRNPLVPVGVGRGVVGVSISVDFHSAHVRKWNRNWLKVCVTY